MIFHKIRHIFTTILFMAALSSSLALTGCQDDLLYVDGEIVDEEVEITAEVIYKPMARMALRPGTRAEAGKVVESGSDFYKISSINLFVFDKEGEILPAYSGPVSFENKDVTDTNVSNARASFKKTMRSGRYYMFAVVNVPEDKLQDVKTIADLRGVKLEWDGQLSKDLEMFGVFRTDDSKTDNFNEDFESDVLVEVSSKSKSFHSWARRAASKVTVAFDGANLRDNVTVYIKSAKLVDIADGCYLGNGSKVDQGEFKFAPEENRYIMVYGEGDDKRSWPSVTNKQNYTSYTTPTGETLEFHDEMAKSLPLYENLQGQTEENRKYQDRNGDGIIEGDYDKDNVPNGTYLEVEGFYVSNNPTYKSSGDIKYRFMLGANISNDFNVVRNHHYQVTLKFKGNGNDVDWHIEYKEHILEVTEPEIFNYRGEFFVPSNWYTYRNLGHEFSKDNIITVTSYWYGSETAFEQPVIYYEAGDYGSNDFVRYDDSRPAAYQWFSITPEDEDDGQKRHYRVAAAIESKDVKIDNLLAGSNGSYNLASSSGSAGVMDETANTYIVSGKGTYTLPLVYGNAIANGGENPASYGFGEFKNHVNGRISSPYIEDSGRTPSRAVVLWQDDDQLSVASPVLVDNAYARKDGKGNIKGLRFTVNSAVQGNFVVAVVDTQGDVMWSWQIWCTSFAGFEESDRTTTVTNNTDNDYDLMALPLGYCTGHDETIKYFPGKKVRIKFAAAGSEEIITIERKPHIALPQGNSTLYQWGRKDPFPGYDGSTGANKKVSNLYSGYKSTSHHGAWDVKVAAEGNDYNPPRFWDDGTLTTATNPKRSSTKDMLSEMVKWPAVWHNPPRANNPDASGYPFVQNNDAPSYLWGGQGYTGYQYKSVYDPCPPGYQVPPNSAFTGFTVTGTNQSDPQYWNDVLEKHMCSDYKDEYGASHTCADGVYSGKLEDRNKQAVEFYTTAKKNESVVFPITGYRDWDQHAQVFRIGKDESADGFSWCNSAVDKNNSYYLHFYRTYSDDWVKRSNSLIAPKDGFLNGDGCPVRPVRY